VIISASRKKVSEPESEDGLGRPVSTSLLAAARRALGRNPTCHEYPPGWDEFDDVDAPVTPDVAGVSLGRTVGEETGRRGPLGEMEMTTMPAVIVRRGSLLSALVYCLFTFLTISVIATIAAGMYALSLVDRNIVRGASLAGRALAALPEWRSTLPPALSDALNDRRDVAYRDQLTTQVRIVPEDERHGRAHVLIEVRNGGTEAVSVLALRVTLESDDGVPLREFITYAATPLAVDNGEWRGPLLPGAARTVAREIRERRLPTLKANVEVCELRVWSGAAPTESPGDRRASR
jgi:hypothetical protein